MNRRFRFVAALCGVMALALVLVGCQKVDNEALIQEEIVSYLEPLKQGDWSTVFDGHDLSKMEDLTKVGITTQQFLDSASKGIDYTIGDIKVNDKDNTATAEVTFTCKNLKLAMANAQAEAMSVWAQMAISGASQDELAQKFGPIFLDEVDKLDPETHALTLRLTRDSDNKWTWDTDSQDELIRLWIPQS